MSEHYFEPELLHISSGYFWMGSHESDSNAWNTEKPFHRMYLDEYWIGRYPITNREFQCFTTENPNYKISKNVDSQNDKRNNPAAGLLGMMQMNIVNGFQKYQADHIGYQVNPNGKRQLEESMVESFLGEIFLNQSG